MHLDFDWELTLFKGLRALWRKATGTQPGPTHGPEAVHLTSLQASLTVLAQLEAGGPVRILAAPDAGSQGWDGTQPILRLPHVIHLAPDFSSNRELYLLRTLLSIRMLHLQAHEGLKPPPQPGIQALETLRLACQAAETLSQDFPHFGAAWDSARRLELARRSAPAPQSGKPQLLEQARIHALQGGSPWTDPALLHALATQTPDAARNSSPGVVLWGELEWISRTSSSLEVGAQASAEPPPTGTERPAPPPARASLVTLDPKEQEDHVLQHTFEKVETADAWKGGARDTDGSDTLDEQLEALQEVELGDVIRGGDPARSILKADILLDAQVPEVGQLLPGEKGIPFDEWDEQHKTYRSGWCTVYPSALPSGNAAWAQATLLRYRREIEHLRRKLEAHRQGFRRLDRQLEGSEIDLTALIDELADRKAGSGGSPRLYTREARQPRQVATTVLIDVSLSTDAWVEDRRVLDVARESVLVLGEVAHALGDGLEILAFASQTRNQCRVFLVRGFDEPWSMGRNRLGSLKPQGYTRIGPALRYALRGLSQREARHRLLLLISDGKPTDYDRYEGRYGIHDIRQALREAEAQDITCHALAVDRAARETLPMMFGPHGWDILLHPQRLPELLTTVYGRMTER